MVITPDTVTHWIYELFHEKGVKNSKILHFHYTENPFIDDVKKREYEELKELNEDLYRKYTEGKWGRLSNLVYDGNWDTFTESISQLGGAEFYTAGCLYDWPQTGRSIDQKRIRVRVRSQVNSHMACQFRGC